MSVDRDSSSEARDQAIGLARAILEGRVELIEGARLITYLLPTLGLQDLTDLMPFAMIDDESDDIPTGPERRYWNPDALEKKDQLLEQVMVRHASAAIEACRTIILRLEDRRRTL